MGTFRMDCDVVNLHEPGGLRRCRNCSSIPARSSPGCRGRPWIRSAFRWSRGTWPSSWRTARRSPIDPGYAILRAGGFETVDEVVFGQPGDLALLGARTLEGFGAAVDPSKKRLVAAGPHPGGGGGPGSAASEFRFQCSGRS